MHIPPEQPHMPSGSTCPPVNRMTNWCKNITLPQTSFVGGKNTHTQVQHYAFSANWAFACKTETLGSLDNPALLIKAKSSKSKNQVVHEQKFKDPLSSTCQTSPERIVLDLESKVHQRPRFYSHYIFLSFIIIIYTILRDLTE